MQCGYFMALTAKRVKPVRIESMNDFGVRVINAVSSNAFFCVLNDDSTVQLFWDAIKSRRSEDARALMSKNFAGQFDISEFENYVGDSSGYKNLIKVGVSASPRSCKTNSILLFDSVKKDSIIHLHMVREPDALGTWKIYGIEKE